MPRAASARDDHEKIGIEKQLSAAAVRKASRNPKASPRLPMTREPVAMPVTIPTRCCRRSARLGIGVRQDERRERRAAAPKPSPKRIAEGSSPALVGDAEERERAGSTRARDKECVSCRNDRRVREENAKERDRRCECRQVDRSWRDVAVHGDDRGVTRHAAVPNVATVSESVVTMTPVPDSDKVSRAFAPRSFGRRRSAPMVVRPTARSARCRA